MAAPSERTTLRRLPARGRYDRDTVHAILDEGLICHLAFLDDGRPAVMPTGYARVGDSLYLHGSRKNHALLATIGCDCSVEVSLLDGIVLARSAFSHSFNYRSVVILGRGEEVVNDREKAKALEAIVEHIVPGRSAECRAPNQKEIDATLVVKISLEESSAKVRSGPPHDDREDMEFPVWAGVLPVRLKWGPAEADNDRPTPEYVTKYRRGR